MKHIYMTIFCALLYFGAQAQAPLLESEGGIKVSDTALNDDGIIKYDNNDLEGRVNGEWRSLTQNTSHYTSRTSLNTSSITIPNQDWYTVGPTTSFTKHRDDSVIELEYGGTLSAASISSGFGLWFEIRVDNLAPDHKTRAVIKPAELEDQVYTKSVYENLPAGTYTFTMYVQAPNTGASATGVVVDPGGWRAAIICREL